MDAIIDLRPVRDFTDRDRKKNHITMKLMILTIMAWKRVVTRSLVTFSTAATNTTIDAIIETPTTTIMLLIKREDREKSTVTETIYTLMTMTMVKMMKRQILRLPDTESNSLQPLNSSKTPLKRKTSINRQIRLRIPQGSESEEKGSRAILWCRRAACHRGTRQRTTMWRIWMGKRAMRKGVRVRLGMKGVRVSG